MSMTHHVGVTVGLGALGIALMITVLALIILSLARLEHSIEEKWKKDDQSKEPH